MHDESTKRFWAIAKRRKGGGEIARTIVEANDALEAVAAGLWALAESGSIALHDIAVEIVAEPIEG